VKISSAVIISAGSSRAGRRAASAR
jgi:hypothetical protein